jgi:hypothetical protein
MDKIQKNEIKMKPKIYFIIGSILTIFGLAASVVSSVFLISIIRFSLRTHGPMGSIRFEQLLNSIPWWALILTPIGLIIGISLLKKYDFSYKKNFFLIIIGFVLSILLAGYLIDNLGLNGFLFRYGQINGVIIRKGRQFHIR